VLRLCTYYYNKLSVNYIWRFFRGLPKNRNPRNPLNPRKSLISTSKTSTTHRAIDEPRTLPLSRQRVAQNAILVLWLVKYNFCRKASVTNCPLLRKPFALPPSSPKQECLHIFALTFISSLQVIQRAVAL